MKKAHRFGELTRRGVIGGGLAALSCPSITYARPSGAHTAIAEFARKLPPPREGRLRVLIPLGSEANLAPITRAFHEATDIPVEVKTTEVRDVASALILDKLLKENAYDVALPATFDLPDLARANAIQCLDGFSDTRDLYHEADGILYSEGDSVDGKSYGYQTDGDAYIMFYNRRFFEDQALSDAYARKFGSPLEPPADWDTLDRQIMFISSLGDGRKGAQFARVPGYVEWEWWLRLHAKGIWPLSPDLRPQIAGDEGVAALEDMIRIKSSLQPERGGLNSLFSRWEDYEKGDTYAAMSWGGSQKFHRRPGGPIANDLVHTLIPGGTGPDTPDALPYFNWGWSYSVTSETHDPELAHAFCLFAVSREMSLRAVRRGEGFFDPFRREHHDDDTIKQIYGKAFLKVHRLSMESAMPDFYLADRADYITPLSNWIGLALDGHATPRDAMANVAEAWDAVGQSGDTAARRAQWRRLRAKYPDAIARRLRDAAPA